jgi:hypothetical protein
MPPLKDFICPNKERISVVDCLKEGECRNITGRCAPRTYLVTVGKDRIWKGKASTTQLLAGTMQAFLKIKHDYAVDPDSRAFSIHGTNAHAKLEASGDECSQLEVAFNDEKGLTTGIVDNIETENGYSILLDYKTSGSYKVAKALGYYMEEEETGEVYKSGKRIGQKKKIKVLKQSNDRIDRRDWELQLNNYFYEIKKRGQRLDKIKLFVMVRDGGTYIARSRGVERNIYYFDIPILPEEEVTEYFETKRKALMQALEQDSWDLFCTPAENWDGLKCKNYCEVAEFCPLGQYLKAQVEEKQTEEEEMPIHGLSEKRQFPRIIKIRLGEKVKKVKEDGKEIEYPKELDYFKIDVLTPDPDEKKRITDQFHGLYGEQPKRLRVLLPVDDPEIFFPQWYERYGSSSLLQCRGDGVEASCKKEFADKLEITDATAKYPKVKCNGEECPYYKEHKCVKRAKLFFMLYELNSIGVCQLVTSSSHAIININSEVAMLKGLLPRVSMIPLILERREELVETPDGKASRHYICHISNEMNISELAIMARNKPNEVVEALWKQSGLALPEGKTDLDGDVEPPDDTTEATTDQLWLLATDSLTECVDADQLKAWAMKNKAYKDSLPKEEQDKLQVLYKTRQNLLKA